MSADNDNLDDLFRQQLGPHATPPGPDLARRLAELAEAERLDARFRTGLGSHASQPRREVWERLEDEHLRPQPQRRRRVVAWWQLSAVAVLLLTLLAGGLWRGGYFAPVGGLASQPAGAGPHSARTSPAPTVPNATNRPGASPTPSQEINRQPIAQATVSPVEKNRQNFTRQATAVAASSSSPPIATTTRPRRTATAPRAGRGFQPPRQLPDAAAGQLATTGRRNGPASQPLVTPTENPAAHPSPPLVAMTAPTEVVEVEVRRGPEPSRPAPAAVAALAEPVPSRRPRLRLGGLLRQADHLVHGEPVSLAEATGLAENVTVQARFGGRVVSKTIQL